MKKQITGRLQFILDGILVDVPIGMDSFPLKPEFIQLYMMSHRMDEIQLVGIQLRDKPAIKKHKEKALKSFNERMSK